MVHRRRRQASSPDVIWFCDEPGAGKVEFGSFLSRLGVLVLFLKVEGVLVLFTICVQSHNEIKTGVCAEVGLYSGQQ